MADIILRRGEHLTSKGEIKTTRQLQREAEKKLVQKLREKGKAPIRRTVISVDPTGKQTGAIIYRGGSRLGRETEATQIFPSGRTKTIRGSPEFIQQQTKVKPLILKKAEPKFPDRTRPLAGVPIHPEMKEVKTPEKRYKIKETPIIKEKEKKFQEKIESYPPLLLTKEKTGVFKRIKRKIAGKIQRGKLGEGLQLSSGQLATATGLATDKKGQFIRDKKGRIKTIKVSTPEGDATKLAVNLGLGAIGGLGTKTVMGIASAKAPAITKSAQLVLGGLYAGGIPKRTVDAIRSGGAKGVVVEFSGDAGFFAGMKIPSKINQKASFKQVKKLIPTASSKKAPTSKQITKVMSKLNPNQQMKFQQNLIRSYPTKQAGKIPSIATKLIQAQQKTQLHKGKLYNKLKTTTKLDVQYKKVNVKKPTVFNKIFNKKSKIKDIDVTFDELKALKIKGVDIAKGKTGMAKLRFKNGKLKDIRLLSADSKDLSKLPRGLVQKGALKIQKISKIKLKKLPIGKKAKIRPKVKDIKMARFFKPVEKPKKPRIRIPKPKKKLMSFKEFLKLKKAKKTGKKWTQQEIDQINTKLRIYYNKLGKKPPKFELTKPKKITPPKKVTPDKIKPEVRKFIPQTQRGGVITITQQPTVTAVRTNKPIINIAFGQNDLIVPIINLGKKSLNDVKQGVRFTPKQEQKLKQIQELTQKEKEKLKPDDKIKITTNQIIDKITIPIQPQKITQIIETIQSSTQKTTPEITPEQRIDEIIDTIMITTPAIIFPKIVLPPKKKKKFIEGFYQTLLRAKKSRKKVYLEYTPTLRGLGTRAIRTTGEFTGFETRGNIIRLKPVVVKKHPRSNLKHKKYVKRYRRKKPN